MDASSSSEDTTERQAGCASSSDSEDQTQSTVKRRISRFTTAQKAFLNAYYSQGMKGTGKKHYNLIRQAATDAGLHSAQVKVSMFSIFL